MKRLKELVLRAQPGTALQFRPRAYGPEGIRRFLMDLIAMANASIDGSRYIVVGVQVDDKTTRRLRSVPEGDFAMKPSYQSIANEFIEPPIRLHYGPVRVEGETVGVFRIGDCQDRPYMMRIDHSETLRRGDAWMRIEDSPVRMGRRQYQDMFERKFRESMAVGRVEVGFPGDIIHKSLEFQTCDLGQLPSAVAAAKLNELLKIRKSSKNRGATTVLERMMHARLFGSDDPYEGRSTVTIVDEMAAMKKKHDADDRHFLFEKNGRKIQLVVLNQGEEEIRGASLTLLFPRHEAVHIAEELPDLPLKGDYVKRDSEERENYPAVTIKNKSIEVSSTIGKLPPHVPVEVFGEPIRICAGSSLQGRRVGIHYKLFGQNLRKPVHGKLRLVFAQTRQLKSA